MSQGVTATDKSLQHEVAAAGERLRSAISHMLALLAEAGVREQREIQSALNLSQPVTSRLMSCVRVNDPLATLARVPGPQGLRKILKGAAKAGIESDCLQRISSAIEGVENLINHELGNRDALDSLLSDWVHESRRTYELRQKCASFKAACAVRGIQTRVNLSCGLLHPGDIPGRLDTVQIEALYGCRRVRPSAALRTTTRHLAAESHDIKVTGLKGQPVTSIHDIIVPEFTTANLDHLEIRQDGTLTQAIIHGLPLRKGVSDGDDLVAARVSRGLLPAYWHEGHSPTSGMAAHTEPPSVDLVLDVLLHEDVWRDSKPDLRVFDTIVRGLAHPDDPMRQADRIDMLESVVFLGQGPASFRVAEVPRYVELIEQVCDTLGWNVQHFRGYRCKIRYPFYGSQVCMAFPLPAEAQAESSS